MVVVVLLFSEGPFFSSQLQAHVPCLQPAPGTDLISPLFLRWAFLSHSTRRLPCGLCFVEDFSGSGKNGSSTGRAPGWQWFSLYAFFSVSLLALAYRVGTDQ